MFIHGHTAVDLSPRRKALSLKRSLLFFAAWVELEYKEIR